MANYRRKAIENLTFTKQTTLSPTVCQLMPVVMVFETFSIFIPLRPYESCLVARHNLFDTLPSSLNMGELVQI